MSSASDAPIDRLHTYRSSILSHCRLPSWVHARLPVKLASRPERDFFPSAPVLELAVPPPQPREKPKRSWQLWQEEEAREKKEEERRAKNERTPLAEKILTQQKIKVVAPKPLDIAEQERKENSSSNFISPISIAAQATIRISPIDLQNYELEKQQKDIAPHYHGLSDVRFRELTSPIQQANVFPYQNQKGVPESESEINTDPQAVAFRLAQIKRRSKLVKKEVIHYYQKLKPDGTEMEFKDGSRVIEQYEESLGTGNRQAESIRAGIQSRRHRPQHTTAINEPSSATAASAVTEKAPVPVGLVAPLTSPRLLSSVSPSSTSVTPSKSVTKVAPPATPVVSSAPILRPTSGSVPAPRRPTAQSIYTTTGGIDHPESILDAIVENGGVYTGPSKPAHLQTSNADSDSLGPSLVHLPPTMEPQIMKIKGIQPGTTERQIRWCFEGVQVDVRRVRMQAGNEGIALVEYWPLGCPPRRVKRTVYERLYRIQGGEQSAEARHLAEITKKGGGEAPRFFGLDTSTSYTDRRAKLLAKVAVDMSVLEKYYTLMTSTPVLNTIHHRVDRKAMDDRERIEAAMAAYRHSLTHPNSSAALESFAGVNISKELAEMFAAEQEATLEREAAERKELLAKSLTNLSIQSEAMVKSKTETVIRDSRKRASLLMNPEISVLEMAQTALASNTTTTTTTTSPPTYSRRASVPMINVDSPPKVSSPSNKRASMTPGMKLTISIESPSHAGTIGTEAPKFSPASSSSSSTHTLSVTTPRMFKFEGTGFDAIDISGVVSPRRASLYSKNRREAEEAERKVRDEMKQYATNERRLSQMDAARSPTGGRNQSVSPKKKPLYSPSDATSSPMTDDDGGEPDDADEEDTSDYEPEPYTDDEDEQRRKAAADERRRLDETTAEAAKAVVELHGLSPYHSRVHSGSSAVSGSPHRRVNSSDKSSPTSSSHPSEQTSRNLSPQPPLTPTQAPAVTASSSPHHQPQQHSTPTRHPNVPLPPHVVRTPSRFRVPQPSLVAQLTPSPNLSSSSSTTSHAASTSTTNTTGSNSAVGTGGNDANDSTSSNPSTSPSNAPNPTTNVHFSPRPSHPNIKATKELREKIEKLHSHPQPSPNPTSAIGLQLNSPILSLANSTLNEVAVGGYHWPPDKPNYGRKKVI